MFVSSVMKPNYECITATRGEPLLDVLNKILKHNIQSVPVLEDEKFIGLISKQMIYEAYFNKDDQVTKEQFLSETKAEDIVNHEDLYITKDDVLEKTITSFKGFPILAVVDQEMNFLGIVTRFEVLEEFESAFGVKKSGIRIAFTSIEEEGRISRVTDILDSYHSNIISIATFDETDKLARRIVIKIEKNQHVDKLLKRLEKRGFRILDVKEM